MEKLLNIALLQWDLRWENPRENMRWVSNALDGISAGCDLVFLPETFSTGFTMDARNHAAVPGDELHRWMEEEARKRRLHIAGSVIVLEGEKVYNRLYMVGPGGWIGSYDKRHLFRMGREDAHFTAGSGRKVFDIKGFRLCPQICYDLRFPVFARNRNDYDILFYVANWPAPRHPVWETLLRARAIENQAYVIGVSRSGVDGEGVDHLGGSCIIDPLGAIEGILGPEEAVLEASINLKKIREFREKFPVWKDADDFRIQDLQ